MITASESAPLERNGWFDPRRVGGLECATWVAYYRRERLAFVRLALALSHDAFGLSWPVTARGAWLVSRAVRAWAPLPDNDPERARRTMERFYRLVKRRHGTAFDPARAAELEVEWWRVHRECQYGDGSHSSLVDALAAFYSCLFGASASAVREPAEQRALAMRYSDQWVKDGCALGSPLIVEQRAALIRSYTGLLAAVNQL